MTVQLCGAYVSLPVGVRACKGICLPHSRYCRNHQDSRLREALRSPMPQAFVLVRDEDATGISGTGIVAGGVLFPDGVVALRWYSQWPTSVVFHDRGLEAVEAVHGHDGKTRIVMARGVLEVEGGGKAQVSSR